MHPTIVILWWWFRHKEYKLKLFGPDILRYGGGLPLEGVVVKEFGMSFET